MFLKKKRPEGVKAVKFLLAPRPQRDPLAADHEAPQHVLIPKDGSDIDQISERLKDFDPKIFASKDETKIGMLERAHNADGKIIDTDILQAMSKEFDYEDPNNILDDDFMNQAGGLIEDEGELLEDELELDSDFDLETERPHHEFVMPKEIRRSGHQDHDHNYGKNFETDSNFDDDNRSETRTVFTNYSMTSSVMRRNQGLQQIDEHFERLFEREYANDMDIGALDLNEVKGEELLENIDQIKQLKQEVKIARNRDHGNDYKPEIVSDHHKHAIIGDDDVEEQDDLVEIEVTRRENRIDCESILSYNSNLYNHPKLIVEPRRKTTSQSTMNDIDMDNSDSHSRSDRGQSIASTRATVLSKLSLRPQNETPEEKRARKKALKQYRHERRQERKQNQRIFKSEQAIIAKQQNNKPALQLA